jgi:hypothetical protein
MDENNLTSEPAKQNHNLRKYGLPALIILVIVAGGVVGFLQSKKPKPQTAEEAQFLKIVSVSPQGTAASANSKIYISFNFPVVAHHVAHFIQVGYTSSFWGYPQSSAQVTGNVVQGASLNEVVFEPSVVFPPGAKVSVTLKQGLPSESGRKLLTDYLADFSIRFEGNTGNITYNGFAGKFMGFSADKGVSLTAEFGSDISRPVLKIFKVTDKRLLLNDFVYHKGSDYQGYAAVYGAAYINTGVDVSKLALVKEIKDLEQNNQITFKEPAGLYLFQIINGNEIISTSWISLNETGLHLRQDDQKIVLAAQELATNRPKNNVIVSFYNMADKPTLLQSSAVNGIGQFPLNYDDQVDLVIAENGSELMLVPIGLPNSQAEIAMYQNLAKKQQIFIYVDRPVYKIGEKIKFRGLVRQDNDGNYTLPPVGTKIRISFAGSQQIVELREGGAYSGEFDVPPNLTPSTYYMYADTNVDNTTYYSNYSTYFEVSDFQKPEFGLETSVNKPDLLRGETITATVNGKYFDGRALDGKTVKYGIYRKDFYETEKAAYNRSFNLNNWGGMCGGGFSEWEEYYGEPMEENRDLVLDGNGNGTVTFDTKTLSGGISQEVTFVVELTDDHDNRIVGAKSSIVHAGEFNIFFRPGSDEVRTNDPFTAVFYAETRDGVKLVNKPFEYNLIETLYTNGRSENITLKSGSVMTDAEGLGKITDTYSSPGYKFLYLEVKGKDSKDNSIQVQKYLRFVDEQQNDIWTKNPVLSIISNVSNLTPGQRATLEISSPAELNAFVTFERGRVYQPQWLSLKKGQNSFSFDVPNIFTPSITPTFSFFHQGEYRIEGLSLNVPALSKLLTVKVSSDKEQYNPGDVATLTIETYDSANRPVSADVGVGIVDKAIFALRKNVTPPLHSSFYFFRGRSTNTSSSLTWIGAYDYGGRGGGGGGDLALLEKEVNTLYWNPELKTDATGKVTIQVPVYDSQTTWRVVSLASTDDTRLGQEQKDFLVAR